MLVLHNPGWVRGAWPSASGCSRAEATATETLCPHGRAGAARRSRGARGTLPCQPQRGERRVVPSVATSQNYVQLRMHTCVHTLTPLLTLASSPLHSRRARAQLCLAGRRCRLSARPSDVVALTEGQALPAPGVGASTACLAVGLLGRRVRAGPRSLAGTRTERCVHPQCDARSLTGAVVCALPLYKVLAVGPAHSVPRVPLTLQGALCGGSTGRTQAGNGCPHWSTPCTPWQTLTHSPHTLVHPQSPEHPCTPPINPSTPLHTFCPALNTPAPPCTHPSTPSAQP